MEEQLDSLDRGRERFGSDASDSSGKEVEKVKVLANQYLRLSLFTEGHLIYLMKENDEDSQLSDLMTSYLQHFKVTTGAKLSLVEALCVGGDSLQTNPQFLLSKFSTKSFAN